MSTLHPDVQIGDDRKSKPETVTFYNKTKSGVDVIDQMCRKYSVKSASRRWPFHTFCNILDLAGINSWVLYKEVTKEKISSRDFLLALGEELTKEIIDKKCSALTAQVGPSQVSDTRGRCQVRGASCTKSAKSAYDCASCKKTVCKKCTAQVSYICVSCKPDDSDPDL